MKPRKLSIRTGGLTIRGECVVLEGGERVIDTSLDLFDGGNSAAAVARYMEWLKKALKWVKNA